MAVEAIKSTSITALDAPSPDQANAVTTKLNGARLKETVGYAAVANAASIGSTYRLARVSSSVRISQLLLSCSAITSATADIGVYETAANGGAAVDADLFASAQAVSSALVNSDVTHEAGTYAITDVEKPLWQALGLTKDPGKLYDIAATLTAAATAAGNIGLKVRFADGN